MTFDCSGGVKCAFLTFSCQVFYVFLNLNRAMSFFTENDVVAFTTRIGSDLFQLFLSGQQRGVTVGSLGSVLGAQLHDHRSV